MREVTKDKFNISMDKEVHVWVKKEAKKEGLKRATFIEKVVREAKAKSEGSTVNYS